MLDEGDSIAVHSIYQLFRFFLTFAKQAEAPEFFGPRRIKKNVKRVWQFPQKVRRPAAHDYAVAGIGGFFHDPLAGGYKTIGVERLLMRHRHTAFIAAAPEDIR